MIVGDATAFAPAARARERRLWVTTFALAASGSTAFVFNVVLARRLPVETFGELARTYALGLAVAQLTMSSVAPALAWRVSGGRDDAERRSLAHSALTLAVAVAVATATLYLPLAAAGLAPRRAVLLVEGSAFAAVYSIYFGQKLLLFALDLVEAYAIAELVADALFFTVFILLAWLWPLGAVASFPLAYGVFALAVGRRLRCRGAVRRRLIDARLRDYALFAGIATYSSAARAPIAVVLAGALGGAGAAAHLGAVVAICVPLFLLPQAAGLLTFAAVSRSAAAAAALVRRSLLATADLIGCGMALAIVAVPFLLPVVLGSEYRDAARLFVILGACLTPQLLATPVGNGLGGEGRVRLSAAISGAGLLIAVLGVSIGAAAWGATGAAAGLGASSLVTGTALLTVAVRSYGVPVRSFRSTALVAGAVVLVSLALAAGTP